MRAGEEHQHQRDPGDDYLSKSAHQEGFESLPAELAEVGAEADAREGKQEGPPREVAERFSSEVPASEQSEEVTKLLRRRLFKTKWPTLTDEEREALNEFDHAADDAWLVETRQNSPK